MTLASTISKGSATGSPSRVALESAAPLISEQTSGQVAESRSLRRTLTATKATMLASAGVNALVALIAAPALIQAIPKLFGPEPGRSLTTTLVLTGLGLASATAAAVQVAFVTNPTLDALKSTLTDRLASVEATAKTSYNDISERLNGMQTNVDRLLNERRIDNDRHSKGRNRHVRLADQEFDHAAPGVTTTINPGMATEVGGGLASGGCLQLHKVGSGELPSSLQRLDSRSTCTEWRVVIYLDHDIASMSRAARFLYALTAYPEDARCQGKMLDLSKLKLQAMSSPAPDETVVILPRWDLGGAIYSEVLKYTAVGSHTASQLGVSVRGPAYQRALDDAGQAARYSPEVTLGALRHWLGSAAPNQSGFVPAAGIEAWLRTKPPSISEMRNWSEDLGVTMGDHFTLKR